MKDGVYLTGFNKDKKLIFSQFIGIHDYYDDLHPVIDSNDFRRGKGIVSLRGTVYDDAGDVESEWENQYSADGKIIMQK